jgi:hypothetical protein
LAEDLLRFPFVLPLQLAVRFSCIAIVFGLSGVTSLHPQQDVNAAVIQNASVIQGIDASVHARESNLLGYTVTEHYTVLRNHDEKHPAAEMVVKTTYRRDVGKNFSIVSLNGSVLLRKMLEEVLATEKKMTEPANRSTAVIIPANYEMTVKGPGMMDGRSCIALTIKPRRISPYLFNGTVWVDAQNQAIVRLEGVAAKSPTFLSGPSQVSRQYTMIDGFAMATRARAVSNSPLLGETIVNIDYTGYQLQPAGQ